MNKIMTLTEAENWSEKLHKENKSIVFTNGCFDIVHAGHIKSFKEAKSFGDYLIVGVNSDNSIRQIKGPNRPIVEQENRIFLLNAIEYIDAIVVFEETTTVNLLKHIKPDIFVKGSDWQNKELPERNTVEAYGGEIRFINLTDKLSTTNIINKIIKIYGINS